ncbi:hypothetical protein [Pseudomonas sp. GXZC]|uniref:hypothetical protein n=1 Tax=Pseudomonas sp. GXZC TaxID=3003351 RepID=UPI0022AA0C2D|nr:hypothetical protein [Pseudomonas sp. GXZC]WAT31834.1 hypothetical protein OZ428_16265 [Pseudomonas sp. GXZC]
MLEITGNDLTNLSDGDLRTLVARLALSELRAQGYPLSSVTAGGNQDAADGGLDVRVECPNILGNPDFVPRSITGFQVKKPDMPASAIREEMSPKGILRPVIEELAAVSGAYIIVSAQGSVADKPLKDRRNAIRDQLRNLPTSSNLFTDFYDRDRLATWANEYPGIVAWIRGRNGFQFAGWGTIGTWAGLASAEPAPFLFDDQACLIDERSREHEQLNIAEGLQRLRSTLSEPRRCVRLIGLSGQGKTRLVEALFESGVGEAPLDPSLALYTDYSVETNPTARDMARELITRGQRAILVIDNCNPATHSELAGMCSKAGSHVSLLTVEYDVAEDEPEQTEVFRLQPASSDLITQWLRQSFPNISQVDRCTIADFSNGNFRVARAIAETLAKGENLGKLRNQDLFKRIFQQRNDPDQNLRLAAEDLSLLYSVDGEDTLEQSELAKIGKIRGVDAAHLYAELTKLRHRGIAQSRGRWRAILPHAIANPLASFALERIPPQIFDKFCEAATPRMQKSLSRRLGFLHDSIAAQAAVARWLDGDGLLRDLLSQSNQGIQILTNLAPVAPETVLRKIERLLDGPSRSSIIDPQADGRWHWIRLIKTLAYDSSMFDRSVFLLANFVSVEPEGHNLNSAVGPFEELFHFYLSGTQAPPAQRRNVIRQLGNSNDPMKRRCVSIGLNALLKAGRFSSSSNFSFGARTRNWGWAPKLNRDTWAWYDDAIHLAVELSSIVEDARDILASRARELWRFAACHDALENASIGFMKASPWIEGWLSFRLLHRFEGKGMPEDIRERLDRLIQRLAPSDLLNQARAVVLNRSSGLDIIDGSPDDELLKPWEKAMKMAQHIGRSLALDPDTRNIFLKEVYAQKYQCRSFECGRGLAEETDNITSMWQELTASFTSFKLKNRNPQLLQGFIFQANLRDPASTVAILEDIMNSDDLGPSLPEFQVRVGLDKDGIERLRRAIRKGALQATDFNSIANGIVGDIPPEELNNLIIDISELAGGVDISIDILHMHFYCIKEKHGKYNKLLIQTGRNLLGRTTFLTDGNGLRDLAMQSLISICCSRPEGEQTARDVCERIYEILASGEASSYQLAYVLKSLFETQTFISLDTFLLREATPVDYGFFSSFVDSSTPIDEIDPAILRSWSDLDPKNRYLVLSRCISMFRTQSGEEQNELSPLLMELLEYAPDKYTFLGSYWSRLHPNGWMGSLADVLAKRRASIIKLNDSPHLEVRRWLANAIPEVDHWIEQERVRDRGRDESFE